MEETLTLGFIHIIIFMYLKLVMDTIAHYDVFTKMGWGYFWSREAYQAPKKNWFERYFPMFKDAWHLATFLQVVQVSYLLAVRCGHWWLFIVFAFVGSMVFNFFNDMASKVK